MLNLDMELILRLCLGFGLGLHLGVQNLHDHEWEMCLVVDVGFVNKHMKKIFKSHIVAASSTQGDKNIHLSKQNSRYIYYAIVSKIGSVYASDLNGRKQSHWQ